MTSGESSEALSMKTFSSSLTNDVKASASTYSLTMSSKMVEREEISGKDFWFKEANITGKGRHRIVTVEEGNKDDFELWLDIQGATWSET